MPFAVVLILFRIVWPDFKMREIINPLQMRRKESDSPYVANLANQLQMRRKET